MRFTSGDSFAPILNAVVVGTISVWPDIGAGWLSSTAGDALGGKSVKERYCVKNILEKKTTLQQMLNFPELIRQKRKDASKVVFRPLTLAPPAKAWSCLLQAFINFYDKQEIQADSNVSRALLFLPANSASALSVQNKSLFFK